MVSEEQMSLPNTESKPITVRPDSKGRVALSRFAHGVSSFHVHLEKDGRIVLEPFAEVPARERWLYDNQKALKSVKKGLKESEEGKVRARSFAKYADEPLE
jgi:hypothetical protein